MKDKTGSSFEGILIRSMDSYGRILVPFSFRKVLTVGHKKVIIAKLNKSLVGYTLEEWNKVKKSILSLTKKSKVVNEFRKLFIDHAKECSLDKKWRILIPYALRWYAKLEKQIVFVGLINRFEILSPDIWNTIPNKIKNAANSDELFDLWSNHQKKRDVRDVPDIIA